MNNNKNIRDCIRIANVLETTADSARAELERLEGIDKLNDNLIANIQFLQNKTERLEQEKKELLDHLIVANKLLKTDV